MNKVALVAVLLSFVVELASAIEIEARVIRFKDDAPEPAEILRMNEAGILSYSHSFVAELKPDGSFIDSETTQVPYMTFDKEGKLSGMKTHDVGVSFSGTATREQKGYSIHLKLQTTDSAEIHMERAEDGTTFPQAVFPARAIKSYWVLEMGKWGVVSGRHGPVILFRIRE